MSSKQGRKAKPLKQPKAEKKDCDENVEWSWMRYELQGTKELANQYVQLSIIADIRTVLRTCGCLEAFLNSSLGRSFGALNHDQYSINTCFHQLLAQQVIKSDADASERWFRIGNRFLRFSRDEFVLVTGLRFGHSDFSSNLSFKKFSDSYLYKRLFFNQYKNKGISATKLRAYFNKAQCSSEDKLLIAQILVWAYILHGNNVLRSKIPAWIWVMVEDTTRWESYPWGNYTYDLLLKGIDTVKIQASGRYHFYGCSVALIIWCYEAIPRIGKLFAHKLKGVVGRERPRISRWDFKKIGKSAGKNISMTCTRLFECNECDQSQLKCRTSLSPTYEEMMEPYWAIYLQWIGDTQGIHQAHTDVVSYAEWHVPAHSPDVHGAWNRHDPWPQVGDYPFNVDHPMGNYVSPDHRDDHDVPASDLNVPASFPAAPWPVHAPSPHVHRTWHQRDSWGQPTEYPYNSQSYEHDQGMHSYHDQSVDSQHFSHDDDSFHSYHSPRLDDHARMGSRSYRGHDTCVTKDDVQTMLDLERTKNQQMFDGAVVKLQTYWDEKLVGLIQAK
ncbi:hypothetical protein ACS0TY_012503 [Phlomoides rotata]